MTRVFQSMCLQVWVWWQVWVFTGVGVIFGNHQNPVGDAEINLEIHALGELRLYWAGGKVDLRGKQDLRDGIEHTVAFERTTTYTKLFVDGKEEATGAAGPDVGKRKLGTFVGCDWREGGMGFRGEIISLEINNKSGPCFLRNDIEMKEDGTMTAEACIVVPSAVKQKGGRVGDIFGNFSNPVGDPAINFEVHKNGQLRLFWNNGEIDIYGKTDLRDGLKHIVRFERTRSESKLFVDGRLEASGEGGKDVHKRSLGTFVGCDWREGGMAFRGDIHSLKVNKNVELKRIRLRDDIEPKPDRSMNAEARILVPTAVLKKGGRVGVIFGNHQNPVGDAEINLEIHALGELRIFWAGGKVDLRGKQDLRDGVEHTVAFERTTTYTKLFVDGKEEATGPAGPDVGKRNLGTFVGCDWREGGMGFRGEIISLQINNK